MVWNGHASIKIGGETIEVSLPLTAQELRKIVKDHGVGRKFIVKVNGIEKNPQDFPLAEEYDGATIVIEEINEPKTSLQ